MSKCAFDPITNSGNALGMFRCPECGEMVVAGCPHPDYDLVYECPDCLENNDMIYPLNDDYEVILQEIDNFMMIHSIMTDSYLGFLDFDSLKKFANKLKEFCDNFPSW